MSGLVQNYGSDDLHFSKLPYFCTIPGTLILYKLTLSSPKVKVSFESQTASTFDITQASIKQRLELIKHSLLFAYVHWLDITYNSEVLAQTPHFQGSI